MKDKISPLIRNPLNLFVVLALLLGLAFNALPITSVQASNLVVTNLNDSGAGSLRQAVLDAGDGDLITFDPSLFGAGPQTLWLTSGQILVDKDLGVEGPGWDILSIAVFTPTEMTADRIFTIGAGAEAMITDLTLTRGYETQDYGGAIRNDGALVLDRVNIAENRSCVMGGGIFNSPTGELTIKNSMVVGNSVPLLFDYCFAAFGGSGGGIANQGWLSIENTKVYGNSGAQYGGGLYSHRNSTTYIEGGSEFKYNVVYGFYDQFGSWVPSYGAGVYNGGNAWISDTLISDNAVTYDYGAGGGVANLQWGVMTIHHSQILNNSTNGVGGGIYNEGCPDGSCYGFLTINYSTVSGNHAYDTPWPGVDGVGGGIQNSGGQLTISYSTIDNNIADLRGGGIDSIVNLVSLTNTTISSNQAVAGNGGGIATTHAFDIWNTTIYTNTAGNSGGGVFLYAQSDGYPDEFMLKNSILAGNTATNGANDCLTWYGRELTSVDVNLIEDTTGCTITGTWPIEADPMLGPLQDNGGLTFTHHPWPGSPALDVVLDNDCPDDDQRGQERPVDGDLDGWAYCDVGSVEGVITPNGIAPFANPQWHTIFEDTSIAIHLTGADPDNDYPLAFSISTPPAHGTLTGTPPDVVYTPDANYELPDMFEFMVTDTDGDTDTAWVYINIIPVNDVPIVDAGPDHTIDEGDTVTFTYSFFDPDLADLVDGWTYEWDFGDGSPAETGTLPASGTYTTSHLYLDNGVFTATLTIWDPVGTYGMDDSIVTVFNVNPAVAAGPDQTVKDGTPVTFTATIEDPGVLDDFTYEWDFGDGSSETGAFPAPAPITFDTVHLYPTDGVYTATLTVWDKDGGMGEDEVLITVTPLTELMIEKSDSNDPALLGSMLVYHLHAMNTGPSDASAVMIEDTLPADVTFEGASAGCSEAAGVVTCDVGDLAEGAEYHATITVTVNLTAGNPITNTIMVSGAEEDPELGNNSATETTTTSPLLCVYQNDFEGADDGMWSKWMTSATPIDSRGFLGEFSNDKVSLNLTDLPPHTTAQIYFDLFIIRSWDGNQIEAKPGVPGLAPDTVVGPDHWLFEVDQKLLRNTTFTTWDTYGYKQSYPGDIPNLENPAYAGAQEVRTLGYLFADTYPMDAVYDMAYLIQHTRDAMDLDFMAAGLQPIDDESWGIDNVKVCISAGVDLWPNKAYLPITQVGPSGLPPTTR